MVLNIVALDITDPIKSIGHTTQDTIMDKIGLYLNALNYFSAN